jgi:hypothetical protein
MQLSQIYIPKGKDAWVIKSQVMYFTVNLFGFDVTATGVTVYNDQRINEPIADSVFAHRIVSTYDKTANKKDSAYWAATRPVPLEAEEKKDFVVKDSIRKVYEDPHRIDSLRRKGNKFKQVGFLTGGYTYSSEKYKNTYTLNSLLLGLSTPNIINYNLVEGFNIAPKLSWRHKADTGETIYGDIIARYGFANTHFNAAGRIYYRYDDRAWRGRFWLAGVEGGKYVYQYNSANPVLPWFNTYSTLLYNENDLKLYERWDASVFCMKSYGNGVSWFLKGSFLRRLPLHNNTDFTLAPNNYGGKYPNTPADLLAKATAWEPHNAVLLYAAISYKPGFTYTQYPDFKVANNSKWPRFTLAYQKGVSGLLESKVNYDKWRLNIQDEMRLKLLGTLSYNIAVGGFLNADHVSIPDLMHLNGNHKLLQHSFPVVTLFRDSTWNTPVTYGFT